MDKNELTDYEIVEKCINGDKNMFSEIISRYKNLVYSLVLKMTNNKNDANDLSQEIFIKIYKNLDRYFPEFKFSTWIIKITTNHVIDYRRKKKYDFVSIDSIKYEVPATDAIEDDYLEKEEHILLANMINNLPEMYKTPIIMYHQQGLSYQEIAEKINEPLSKVKNRIFRGRKMLKEQLLTIKGGDNIGYQQN